MSILPMIITIIVFMLLPESIPAHWNDEGEITRWSSKYEFGLFIIPIVCMIFGLAFTALGANVSKRNQDVSWNYMDELSVGLSAFFLLITVYVLHLEISSVDLITPSLSGPNAVPIIIGIIMIILSIGMIFTKSNIYFGIRTKWSMSSEDNWKKSQKFGALLFCIGGLIIAIIGGFLLEGKWYPMIFSLTVAIILGSISVLQSYCISSAPRCEFI
jgi:uncharacterized membrane protein